MSTHVREATDSESFAKVALRFALAFLIAKQHYAAMQQTSVADRPSEHTFLEAISKRLMVRAEYNATQLVLAPHHLFERHGELFVGALNTGKAWRSEDERKLGYFKLKGLSNVGLTDDGFAPLEEGAPVLPRETDKLIFAI